MRRKFSIGDKISDFEVISIDDIPDYKAEGILLRHSSGFEVYALLNDDKECFFNYTIYTPPKNNKGVFHILEHTLLTGSEKYPVRDPFMAMIRNSCNTFLNAMTGPDRTYFPAASPVKKDFDNIFNVYTDAVFAPLLRKESFEQEGIRMSEKDGLHFEGVVFSEMQGDISQHDSVVSSASTRPLFDEDSPYRYEFGGNPPDICDLSYDEFIATYKKHYVPSNMTLFFYGSLELEEKLSYLDREYLSKRETGGNVDRAGRANRWDSPRFYRATSNADEALSSTTMVSWLLGDSDDPELNTELSLIVDLLLGSPGAPLYKAIIDSSLGRDLSSESGMSDSYRELVFSVGIDGTEEKDSKKIEEYILDALQTIANNGLDKKQVEAAIRRKEFRLKEIPGGMPQGYTIFFSRIDKGWAYGKNPSEMLHVSESIKELRNRVNNNPRYFEQWIEKNIINNSHRLLSVVVMDKDTQKRMDAEILGKVEEHKSDYSKEDERRFQAFEAKSDTKDAIDKLPKLDSNDIPNERLDYEHIVDGRIIMTSFPSGGVVYADMAFDVSDFSSSELEDLSLLTRLILMTNVGNLDYSSFLTELRFTTGDANFILESGSTKDGKEKVYLYARFKALFEYYKDALDLFRMLLDKADLHSIDRIKAALFDINSDFQSSIIRAGHQFAIASASASINSALNSAENAMGIEYWYRISNMISSELESLPQRLEKVYRKAFVSNRLIFHLSADEENLESAKENTKVFISSLDAGCAPKDIAKGFIPTQKLLAYTLSTPVNYIALAFKCADQSTVEGAREKLLLSICAKNSLWALIREKGGAYGAGGATDSIEGFSFMYTYRDPRIDGSIDDFKRAIEIERLDEDKLEDARIAVLSKDVRPVGPAAKAMIDFRRFLYDIPDELRHQRKDMLLSVTLDELEECRHLLLERLENDVSITAIADIRKINDSKIPFNTKSLPFK